MTDPTTLPQMPFGKFKGQVITAIDDNYLTWLFSTPHRLKVGPLRTALEAELKRRGLAAADSPAQSTRAVVLTPANTKYVSLLPARCPGCGCELAIRIEAVRS